MPNVPNLPSRTRITTLVMAAVVASLAVLVASGPARAADPVVDAPAMKAFTELLKRSRERPALRVESTLKIRLIEGEQVAETGEVKAEITYVRGAGGVVRIRDFECHIVDRVFFAVHDENESAYYREELDGSPYWPLLINFQDIPYPHLAIFWGEASAAETCMQLLPQTPELVPTALDDVVMDGRSLRRITFSSPSGTLRMLFDPQTWLIHWMEHEVTGGNTVQTGTRRVTSYALKYTTFDAPPPAETIAFDPKTRQRVDLLGALRPRRQRRPR